MLCPAVCRQCQLIVGRLFPLMAVCLATSEILTCPRPCGITAVKHCIDVYVQTVINSMYYVTFRGVLQQQLYGQQHTATINGARKRAGNVCASKAGREHDMQTPTINFRLLTSVVHINSGSIRNQVRGHARTCWGFVKTFVELPRKGSQSCLPLFTKPPFLIPRKPSPWVYSVPHTIVCTSSGSAATQLK